MKFQGGSQTHPLILPTPRGWGHPPHILSIPRGCREISLGISGNLRGNFPEFSWKFPEFWHVAIPPSEIFKMILHNGNIKIFQSAFRKIILRSCLIHLLNMVEITLILHGHQSKFELTRNINMTYVVFFRIYIQFLSNVDYLEGQNVSRY